MALSNVFREPRRELTEQLVGIIAAVPVLYIWWQLGRRITPHIVGRSGLSPLDYIPGLMFAACIMFAGLLAFYFFAIIIHSVGESVCNALARGGIELRPKERR